MLVGLVGRYRFRRRDPVAKAGKDVLHIAWEGWVGRISGPAVFVIDKASQSCPIPGRGKDVAIPMRQRVDHGWEGRPPRCVTATTRSRGRVPNPSRNPACDCTILRGVIEHSCPAVVKRREVEIKRGLIRSQCRIACDVHIGIAHVSIKRGGKPCYRTERRGW